MPISAPGNSAQPPVARGFTLLELLVVLAIMALSAGVVSLALRDGAATRLEREGARLSALLEIARAEARVAGVAVRWVPASTADATPFRFIGLPPSQALPTHWLDEHVTAQVVGNSTVVLGPEAILPAQRIVLRLDEQRLELATDGLGPFAVAVLPEAKP